LDFGVSKCEKFSPRKPQSFSFNFEQLLFLSQKRRNSLNDLKVSTNGFIFGANRIFFLCLSNKIASLGSISSEVSIEIQSNDLSGFISLLNRLEGIPINFNKCDLKNLLSVVHLLDGSSINPFIQFEFKFQLQFQNHHNFFEFIIAQKFKNILKNQFPF
jgi:hypothetical protein